MLNGTGITGQAREAGDGLTSAGFKVERTGDAAAHDPMLGRSIGAWKVVALIFLSAILGVALLRMFAVIGASGSFGWLVLGHVVVVTPYVLRVIAITLKRRKKR